eukprot:6795415-Alexandrium_andersonii.AAC.1
MSASLVGSEMCIRDRSAPALLLGVPRLRLLREARQRCPHLHLGSRGRAAVSYTHLTLPTICSV